MARKWLAKKDEEQRKKALDDWLAKRWKEALESDSEPEVFRPMKRAQLRRRMGSSQTDSLGTRQPFSSLPRVRPFLLPTLIVLIRVEQMYEPGPPFFLPLELIR